jgi:hypothetical protein
MTGWPLATKPPFLLRDTVALSIPYAAWELLVGSFRQQNPQNAETCTK